jgi:predicted small lipoprotein YifL
MTRFLLPALALALAGCGASGPKTHPVAGRIDLPGGDVTALAGSTVEVALASDPSVRGFGEIRPDGTFTLQSLRGGELKPGVPEGKYAARVIPNDEDAAARKKAAKAVAPRFLKFETSGLAVQVPPAGEVALPLAAK